MADITGTTLATYLAEVWSKSASVIYSAEVMFEPKMDHRWEPEIGVGMGDTVNIPEFTQATSADKRSTFGTGASLTLVAPTESQRQLLVNQLATRAYQLPVEMSAQVMSTYVPLMTEDIGRAIAIQIDTELASDNTNGFDAFTAIGSDNIPVTEDIILDGEVILNNNNVPMNNRYFFVSPQTRADLLLIDVFRNQLFSAATGGLVGDKGPGFMGKIFTLDVFMSNLLESGTNGKKNCIMQQEAIAFAAQTEVKIAQDLEITEGLFNVVAGWKAYGFLLLPGKTAWGREVAGR